MMGLDGQAPESPEGHGGGGAVAIWLLDDPLQHRQRFAVSIQQPRDRVPLDRRLARKEADRIRYRIVL
jgi:hypothetical protein